MNMTFEKFNIGIYALEKIELTDHVDSIYDFILDVDYKDQEIVMNLYKRAS